MWEDEAASEATGGPAAFFFFLLFLAAALPAGCEADDEDEDDFDHKATERTKTRPTRPCVTRLSIVGREAREWGSEKTGSEWPSLARCIERGLSARTRGRCTNWGH